jgi:hypothetical protein
MLIVCRFTTYHSPETENCQIEATFGHLLCRKRNFKPTGYPDHINRIVVDTGGLECLHGSSQQFTRN